MPAEHPGESVADSSVSFVAGYGAKSFFPHITLVCCCRLGCPALFDLAVCACQGTGSGSESCLSQLSSLEKQHLPLQFALRDCALAVGHLGVSCTFRAVFEATAMRREASTKQEA